MVDYGNRVGVFRNLDHFRRCDVPLAVLLNTAHSDQAPDLTAARSAAGCEMVARGISNSDSLTSMDDAGEAACLAAVRDAIAPREGRAPQGWSSPWLAQTPNTLDLLAEAGLGYVLVASRPIALKSCWPPPTGRG